MRNFFLQLSLVLTLLLAVHSCNSPEKGKPKGEKIIEYADAETLVLMHNPMGMRAQYNINKQRFDIWISPKTKTSVDYFDRNFSNRDDYTSVFDLITIPGLEVSDFHSTVYDPFYTKVLFNNQVMHIATMVDEPAFVLWFDTPQHVDFKGDKADTPLQRTEKTFALSHPDRGYDFKFVAQLGDGEGAFRQQLVTDKGRSTYARAELSPGQKLVIAGELKEFDVSGMAQKLAGINMEAKIEEVSNIVDKLILPGSVTLKDNPELEKLMDMNRRIWFSMQDYGGPIRASIKEIYYLIWVRDGGMATSFIANSGWAEPLRKWVKFQLENPSVAEGEDPEGKFFGQLVNPITKWEEDGLFYAVWSAFSYWTQTGDDTFINGRYLDVMEEATSWLEKYTFDEEKGLFTRYHYCETPLKNSRGYGWDNAVGKPVSWEPNKYKGTDIVDSYDMYINFINYSVYVMLAAMVEGTDKADSYLAKAETIEKNMAKYFPEGKMPLYGELIDIDGNSHMADGYGLDETDYHWGLSLPYFLPDYYDEQFIGESLLDSLVKHPEGQFLAGYFSVHASLDPHRIDQAKMMEAMEYAAKQCYVGGKHLPMPYSIIEMLDQEDGNPYHDIRPQPFSIGTWLGAMANFGVRRSPFGISVRANPYISKINKYDYQGKSVTFSFEGKGQLEEVILNGESITGTYQLPLNKLTEDENLVVVKMGDSPQKPVLSYSTVQLNDVAANSEETELNVYCYGVNNMVFENAEASSFKVTDGNNNNVEFASRTENGYTHIRFQGNGEYMVNVSDTMVR